MYRLNISKIMATDFLRRMFANIINNNMITLIISGSSIDKIENMELLLSNKYYLLITLIFLTKHC